MASISGIRGVFMLAAATMILQSVLTAKPSSAIPELSLASPVAVDALLKPYRKLEQLSAYTGEEPERCIEASKGVQLCTWIVTPGQASWGKFSSMLETDASVTLLCQLPSRGGKREQGSCSVHANDAANDPWDAAMDQWLEKNGVSGNFFKRGERAEARTKRAGEILAEARTALAISRLVGSAPNSCTGIGAVRTCLWKATRTVEGFPLLSDLLDSNKKIRLWCDVPEDRSPRATQSCRAEVGN
jgi:hypothetical protein